MTQRRRTTAPNSRSLRIGLVGPVAQSIPPKRSGSVETVTAMLADGLVTRGHDVTLFATGSSVTNARLHSIFSKGYNADKSLWPWELCELFNLAAAVERANTFDLIHYQAKYYPMSLAYTRLSPVPVLQTLHHAPSVPEINLWSQYGEAPFIAVSRAQARLLSNLNVVATVHHAVDPSVFYFAKIPEDYLLFLGRFAKGKGVLEAIDVASRADKRLIMAAAENDYFRNTIAPLVDNHRILYAGEVDQPTKVSLLRSAQALLYPLQTREPFGLVLVESMMCGTPVAALDCGAVRELVDDGVTGHIFTSLDDLVNGIPRVLALNRERVRTRAVEQFGPDRMVDEHLKVYSQLVSTRQQPKSSA